jgi:hypothetical protein
MGLEWSPLCLVSTTEELLGRNSSGYSLENREYGREDVLTTRIIPTGRPPLVGEISANFCG